MNLTTDFENFIFKRFASELIFFLVYFILCSTSLIMKRQHFDYLIKNSQCIVVEHEKTELEHDHGCKCAYLYPKDSARFVNFLKLNLQ